MARRIASVTILAVLAFINGPGCGPGTIFLADPDGDAGHPEDGSVQPGKDTDGDGLPDEWEQSWSATAQLDWQNPDSDGDGTGDGQEDYDADGLSNLEELAAGRLSARNQDQPLSPFHLDLLVELDAMAGHQPPDATLDGVAEAFAALPLADPDGGSGVALHLYLDESGIPAADFDGSFEERNGFFKSHGPQALDDGLAPPLPLGKLIHMVAAARRTDLPDRGGETVADANGDPEAAGIFLYLTVIYDLFPSCPKTAPPELPAITPEEMITSTGIHELGHSLQLGHDTDVGGGIDNFNIMAVPTSCGEAQMRTHGAGNADPALGATEAVGKPRYSTAAGQLMKFTTRLSVDTAALDNNGAGNEM
jgi:hypothetical protein